MKRATLRSGASLAVVVALAGHAALAQDRPDAPTRDASASLAPDLAAALRAKDAARVREIVDRGLVLLGDSAGVPEVADEYTRPPENVTALSRAEVAAAFEKLLAFVRAKKWWKIGLDPARTEHLPREVATCLSACVAGLRADVANRDAFLREAIEAGDYLLWTQRQAGAGVIPFPAFRGGKNAAFRSADRFLRRAEAAGRLDEVVRDGWAFDDLDDGGLQFDNALCGVALFELHEVTREERFLRGAVAAADWAANRDCVTNWNYNSFSVYLLAKAHRVTREPRWLSAAKEKALLGVIPGQLRDGPHAGRWADPHNARPAYHYIMIRGLVALFAELPADDPDRAAIGDSIRRAMLARNAEIVERGVMNVDSTLEALLHFQRLPPAARDAIGACRVDEALAVVERHCVARLRRGEGPFAPGVGGLYFEHVLSRKETR